MRGLGAGTRQQTQHLDGPLGRCVSQRISAKIRGAHVVIVADGSPGVQTKASESLRTRKIPARAAAGW